MSDSGDQARRLAASFAGLARQVEAYRDSHLSELTNTQQAFLDSVSQGLDDAHDKFIGIAIQQTLDSIAGDVNQLESVTQDAKHALNHLNSVSEGLKIAAGLADLSAAIVMADYGAIPSAIKGIADAVAKKTDK
jgi:hypothetical protein